MSPQTSASEFGVSEMIFGRLSSRIATDRSTSRRLTAQTSHCVCVMMWVGCSRSSTSSKTS
jgi:uncharacterized protein (UPF0262 family)